MKKIIFLFVSLLAATNMLAEIVLLDPVIEMDEEPSYLEFVGLNTANNYKFILNTYTEEGKEGFKFMLTIQPIDDSQPAQFTEEDLSDKNYWEPMFKRYTQELAGQEMTVQNNIKRLYVKNVKLFNGQFRDYEELELASIESYSDYEIPDNLFAETTSKLKAFECKVGGELSIGTNIFTPQETRNMNVYTYRKDIAWMWNKYKASDAMQYRVYLKGVQYDETGESNYDLNGDGKISAGDIQIIINEMKKQ